MADPGKPSVYIFDSYGLIYRAYFAFVSHPLMNPAGDNVSALVVFFRNLASLITKYNPPYLAAAFDSRTKTFRHELYSDYKATREKAPEDLHSQVPMIEEALRALGVPCLVKDGFEADDIIATVAKKCRARGLGCRILSGDKDLLQLVDEGCLELRPDRAGGGWTEVGREETRKKWGIGPESILDYLSLVGDSSDNVPGVKGVGEKTALKLLNDWGTLDGIYAHADEIKGALGDKVRAGKDDAYFSKRLITLRYDVPLDINFDDFSTEMLDFAACAKVLEKYGAGRTAEEFAALARARGGAQAGLFDEAGAASERAAHVAPGGDAPGAASVGDSAAIAAGDSAARGAESRPALEVRQNKGDYKACVDVAELESFIAGALESASPCLALDTETDSLNTHRATLLGVSLCREEGSGIYVPLVLKDAIMQPCPEKSKVLALLERLFSREDVTLVMHNAKFDLEVLFGNALPRTYKCRIFDTMIAAWLLDSAAGGKSPYGLEYLAETKLGLRGVEFDDIVKKGGDFSDVSLETAAAYSAEDSDFTLRLYNYFAPRLRDAALEDLFYNTEMKVLPILVSMEMAGIHLDAAKLLEYKDELLSLIAEKESAVYSAAGETFNIASPKQLQAVLFEHRGLPYTKKTKTGYSTDTAALEEITEKTSDPLPALILEYRKYTKLLSTYVETLPKLADESGRIHTSFLQTGTATGRLSSRDPNLQNIPVREEAGRRIRSAFTATAGRTLISADYSQIELVVLAHLSGDPSLCRAFREGVDVHRATAALIYGVKADDVTAEERRFAKTVNFGVMYGMSAFRLAKELGINRTRAQDFIDRYFDTYSGVRRYLDDVVREARECGYVQTITGRRRYIPDITSRNKTVAQAASRVAVNTPIQGSAADIVKRAMINVYAALADSKLDCRMLLQVHDELIFECRAEDVEEAEAIIRRGMEGAATLRVPLRVSIEHGSDWGMFH